MNKLFMHNNQGFKWDFEGRTFLLRIIQDEYPLDPRKEDDNLTTMACWHPRLSLGDDVVGQSSPEEYLCQCVRENVSSKEVLNAILAGKLSGVSAVVHDNELVDIYAITSIKTVLGDSEPQKELLYEEIPQDAVLDYVDEDLTLEHLMTLLEPHMEIVPLWLMDHSNLSISCGDHNVYSDPWDSGQVGYIIVRKADILENWPDLTDDDAWRKKAREAIDAEVDIYDQYLKGDVWVYKLCEQGEDGQLSELDMLGSFFGDDIFESGLADEVGFGFEDALKNNTATEGEFVVEYHHVFLAN